MPNRNIKIVFHENCDDNALPFKCGPGDANISVKGKLKCYTCLLSASVPSS